LWDKGHELDEEYIKKVLSDRVIVRGTSLFDHRAWVKIKEYIVKKKSTRSHGKHGLDAKGELKKNSLIELEH